MKKFKNFLTLFAFVACVWGVTSCSNASGGTTENNYGGNNGGVSDSGTQLMPTVFSEHVHANLSNIEQVIKSLTKNTTIVMTGQVLGSNLGGLMDLISCYSQYDLILDFRGVSGMTEVPDNAIIQMYEHPEKLKGILLPDSVTSIGKSAFWSCSGLEVMLIPASVLSIGNEAFTNCCSLLNVYVDSNNPNFSSDDGVLFNKDKTALIQFPAAKTGSYAVPSTVKKIDRYAFFGSRKLTNVTIPNGVVSIGDTAFDQSGIGPDIFIPDSVTEIESMAFYLCRNLKTVTIGKSVAKIGSNAFNDCEKLTSISVDENNSNYSSADGVLFSKDKKILVEYPDGKAGAYDIPSSVTDIGRAFEYSRALTGVTIPSSITKLDAFAFNGCSVLNNVSIPLSVTSIGNQTFQGCSSLTSLVFSDWYIVQWENKVFVDLSDASQNASYFRNQYCHSAWYKRP